MTKQGKKVAMTDGLTKGLQRIIYVYYIFTYIIKSKKIKSTFIARKRILHKKAVCLSDT